MDQIPFDQLVAALKGKGPGDFINSATGGIMKGREMSLEERKRAFLEKVEANKADRQNKEDVYGAQKDLLGLQKDIAGGMQETVVTGPDGKVYRTPPKYAKPEADSLVGSAEDMFRMRTGFDPKTFRPMTDTGTKPPTGGGAAGKVDPKSLSAMWDSTKSSRDTLNKINENWIKDKLNVVGKLVTARTGGTSALRDYDSNKGAIAVAIYRAATGDTRLSDSDAAARALPLLPQYGIDDPETIRRKTMRINYLTKNPPATKEWGEGEDSYAAFIEAINRVGEEPQTQDSPDQPQAVDAFDNALKLLEERKAKKGAR